MTGQRLKKAFTLVELLIVFAILSILASLAVYTYVSQLGKIRLNNSTRALHNSLQLAKMRAATTSMPHGVVIDRGGGANDQTVPGRIYVFIDCDRNGVFTDDDDDPSNNPIINSPADCPADRDALLRDQPFIELERGIYFTDVLGNKTTNVSLVFTELGHCLQGSDFVDGEIHLQNSDERAGKVDSQGIIILGAAGATDTLPRAVVDKNAWK